MTVQTTYALVHGDAYKGMIADLQLCNTVSKLNKGTSNIPFGQGVVTDGDDGAKLPTAASVASEFNGVAVYELNRAINDGDVLGAVPDYDYTVATTGPVWVEVLDNVSKDDAVYLRVGATGLGDFSGIAGAGATLGILLPNVKFLTSATAGNLAKLSLVNGG